MRSAIYSFINQVRTLIDGVTALDAAGASVQFDAFTSVPTNAGRNYLYVTLGDTTAIPVKDRYMEEGVLNINIVNQSEEDSGSNELLYNALTEVQNALAPSLYYTVTSITDGSNITFTKESESFNEELRDGLGKVKTLTLSIFYRLEWSGAVA